MSYGARGKHEQMYQQVRRLALCLGWRLIYRHYDSRRSPPGWPDLVLIHLERRRLLFRELKVPPDRLTTAQAECLVALQTCGQDAGVWTPADEERIVRELTA